MNLRLRIYRFRKKWRERIQRFKTGYCLVLLYHRVHRSNYDPQMLCVSPEHFDEHLTFLKKRFRILSVEEFDECVRKGRFPRRSALVTFDDGYADNYLEALPILEKHKVQALFYISTANIGSKNFFWWDELDLIFKEPGRLDSGSLKQLLADRKVRDSAELYRHYLHSLKRASSLVHRNELMEELRKLRRVSMTEYPEYRCLTREELAVFARSPYVVVGAHTVNHLALSELSPDEQKMEVTASQNYLHDATSKVIAHFSYPYGEEHDYNLAATVLCKELGFRHAAANYTGVVTPPVAVYSFPRIVVRDDSASVLMAKLAELL